MRKYLILFFILPLFCQEGELEQIKQGEPAKFDGVLMSYPVFKEYETEIATAEKLKELTESQEHMLSNQVLKINEKQSQIILFLEKEDFLNKKIKLYEDMYGDSNKAEILKKVERVGYFLLGVLVTGGAIKLSQGFYR